MIVETAEPTDSFSLSRCNMGCVCSKARSPTYRDSTAGTEKQRNPEGIPGGRKTMYRHTTFERVRKRYSRQEEKII